MTKLKLTLLLLFVFGIGVFCGMQKIPKAWAAYLWDRHTIAGGLSGSDGIPLKVSSDGTLYIR